MKELSHNYFKFCSTLFTFHKKLNIFWYFYITGWLNIVFNGASSTEYWKLKTSQPSGPFSTFFAVSLARIYYSIVKIFFWAVVKLFIWLIFGKDWAIASEINLYKLCSAIWCLGLESYSLRESIKACIKSPFPAK